MGSIRLRSEVFRAIRSVLEQIQALRASDEWSALRSNPLRERTFEQLLFELRFDDAVMQQCYELVLQHGLKAEKKAPGALARFLQIMGGPTDASSTFVEGRIPTMHDLRLLVQHHVHGQSLSMLLVALDLAGLNGRIILERTAGRVPSVEQISGFNFTVQSPLQGTFELCNARVICIDGYVESVGEVHHLLLTASETREPCLLAARGFADDVVQTLRVNHDRGTLRVIPVVVPFDLGGMNTLVDIAIIGGGDVVTHLKGELISAIDWHTHPIIEWVTVSGDALLLRGSGGGRARLAAHVAQLRSKRADEANDDLAQLLDARIRSLTSNHVVIRIPTGRSCAKTMQGLDRALRGLRSAIEHGLLVDGTLAAVEGAAQYHAAECAKTLSSLGAIITAPGAAHPTQRRPDA